MTFNGTKLSVRFLGVTLALATCGLLTGNAQAQNRLFVSLSDNSIVSYDISQSTAAAVEASVVVFTSSNLGYPRGLAFDSSGNLYAANYNFHNISKFDSTGTFLSTIGSYPTLNAPTGITFDSSGNLYAANYSNNISKFDSTGTFVSTIGSSGNLDFPIGLAFDSTGNLYASNFSSSSNTISKFDSSGTFDTSFGSGNLNNPSGIAFDSSGNLYATNAGADTISKFDSTGVFQGTLGSGNLSSPDGIAFDSSGNLYAANLRGSTISKFDSSGNFLFRFDTKDGAIPYFLAVGGLNNPPVEVPEPCSVAFGVIAAGSALGLVARKRRS